MILPSHLVGLFLLTQSNSQFRIIPKPVEIIWHFLSINGCIFSYEFVFCVCLCMYVDVVYTQGLKLGHWLIMHLKREMHNYHKDGSSISSLTKKKSSVFVVVFYSEHVLVA